MVPKIEMKKEKSERPATPSRYAGLEAAIATELMIGFWFESESKLTLSQYYGVGAVMAVGALGILVTLVHRSKEGDVTPVQPSEPLTHKSSKWSNLLDYKMDKKSIVNDLCQTAIVSVFVMGYSMLGKKTLKMTPPSIQKFDLEDTGKLVAIVTASEMTREYLIKQKILPEHINI